MTDEERLRVGNAAWRLEDIVRNRFVPRYPEAEEARQAYFASCRANRLYNKGLLALVAISVFELPTWCRPSKRHDLFTMVNVTGQCSVPGVHEDHILLSNIPYLPTGVGLIVELFVVLLALQKVFKDWKLQSTYFAPLNIEYVSVRGMQAMIVLACFHVSDCILFAVRPQPMRFAFVSRTGYLWLLPGVQSLFACFAAVIGEFISISVFLVAAIIFFAWVVVSIFAQMDGVDFNGEPMNKGLSTFMSTTDTMFVSGITDGFLERFLPTYSVYRSTGLLWMTFLIVVHVLLLSLVLDTLVSAYMEYEEHHEKHVNQEKAMAVESVFQGLTGGEAVPDDGEKVSQAAFVAFAREYSACPGNYAIADDMATEMFQIVDKSGSGFIGSKSFADLCKLMQYRLWTTRKESFLKDTCPGFWDSGCFRWFRERVDGEDKDFDIFMNGVLFVNLGLVVIETVYDLNDWEEAPWMENLELIFGFTYLVEVILKLCVYSWQEYWSFGSNRFDFFTTFALLGSSVFEVVLNASGGATNVKRYMNILRLLRLLRMVKQLKRLKSVQFMVNTVIKLVMGSQNILLSLGVIIFFFTTLSVQLWGGVLYASNPELEGTEWRESKWFVFNFNDFLMAFGVWVVTLLNEYVPQFTEAIAASSKIPCSWMVFPAFYVFGVMIVFELVKAFTIEMFLYLTKRRREDEVHGEKQFEPLVDLEKEFAKRGLGFHYSFHGAEAMEESDEEGEEEGEGHSHGHVRGEGGSEREGQSEGH